jgi:hypothetical protein
VHTQSYRSAVALATACEYPVFEPTWFPEDADAPTFQRLWSRSGTKAYFIRASRPLGRPVGLYGHPEAPANLFSMDDWHELPEIDSWSGKTHEANGRAQAIVRRDQWTVRLTGYTSEAEVIRAVESLRLVATD